MAYQKSTMFIAAFAAVALLLPSPANAKGLQPEESSAASFSGEDVPLEETDLSEGGSGQVVLQDCIDQVNAVAAAQGVKASDYSKYCEGTLKSSLSSPVTITPTEATRVVQEAGLIGLDASQLITQAAAGKVKYRKWTHEYYGLTIREKHAGKTYYNGSKAWVSKHYGFTGYHKCHTEGSYAVGWSVKLGSCSRSRTAAQGVDHVHNFDMSFLVKGSPITLTVGLHMLLRRDGSNKGWQVGG